MSPDWLLPDWPAPPNVKALFTTRSGGCSGPPWNSLNLGNHVGDVPEQVAANRAVLQNAIGKRAVFLKQVHGTAVENLGAATPDGIEADACTTSQSDVACAIMVADCLPVLFATRCGAVVAAAHAGWRGLSGSGTGLGGLSGSGTGLGGLGGLGILEATVASIHASFRALAQLKRAQAAPEILAWLGPCIGPVAFEVGAEVRSAFVAVQPRAAGCFQALAQGKYAADLAGLARLRLQALGVTQIYGNDGSALWCTASNPSMFFSHRRDAGVRGNGFGTTGRMAACIWLG